MRESTSSTTTLSSEQPPFGGHLTADSLATLAAWRADGIITPEQMATLIQDPAKVPSLMAAIAAIVNAIPQEGKLKGTVDAIFAATACTAAGTAVGPGSKPAADLPATAPAASVSSEQSATELVVICIDVSGSMQTPFEVDGNTLDTDGNLVHTRDRTRLDAVKQMFYGFRDRTDVYTEQQPAAYHLLGLISYDDKIAVHTTPTANFDVFEDVIDDLKTGGATAIYEAISAACNLLRRERTKHPNADLRVICLSDGQNNRHRVTATDAANALGEIGAICDCLIVGKCADQDLRKLVAATEGECFEVSGLADAYETLESDAVVSLAARWNGAPRPAAVVRPQIKDLSGMKMATIKKGAIVPRPQALAKHLVYRTLTDHLAATTASGSCQQKRIRKELQAMKAVGTDIGANPSGCTQLHVFPGTDADGTVQALKVALLPKSSPYAGRVFELDLRFSDSYPFRPPSLSFVTPIYHFAVGSGGGLCLPVLKDEWNPHITLARVFEQLDKLLCDPETYDPTCNLSLRMWLSELFRMDKETYDIKAEAEAVKSAKSVPKAANGQTMADAVLELLC